MSSQREGRARFVTFCAGLRRGRPSLPRDMAVLVGLLVVPEPLGNLLPAAAAASWVEQGAPVSLAVMVTWGALLWAAGSTGMTARDV